jgi:hypothetical protein
MQTTSLSIAQLARRYGLIALMLFVLAGVQVIQASPLHDHAQHSSVDCGLCHVPVADAPATPHGIVPEFETLAAVLPAVASAIFSSRNPSPYQGRAPPALLF